jgi:predicted DNA-binding antitoxin AbrB/MazE fold protein
MEGEKLQVNMASAFIEEEVHNKLENFKKKFNEQEDNFDA